MGFFRLHKKGNYVEPGILDTLLKQKHRENNVLIHKNNTWTVDNFDDMFHRKFESYNMKKIDTFEESNVQSASLIERDHKVDIWQELCKLNINFGEDGNFIKSCFEKKSETGIHNTYIGSKIKDHNKGNYNSFFGSEAGHSNTTGQANTFVGTVAGAMNTEGSWNVFMGQSAGHSNTIGTNNIFIGVNAGHSSMAGNSCICIGDDADTCSEIPSNQVVIGQGVISFGDNTITLPNNLKSMPHGVEVNFSDANGGCLYPVSSSVRWKENIIDIGSSLDSNDIYKLRPVTFNPSNSSELCIGLIAEEVDKVYPCLVPCDKYGRPSSVRYSLLSVLLLEEMKKLKKKMDNLKFDK